jgi:pheromone shutdown protein TraB
VTRMNKLLAEGDRDGVVEALFQSVEEISDEDMAALRLGRLNRKFDRIILAVSFVILAAVVVVVLALVRMIHLLRLTLQIVLLRVQK